MFRRKLCLRRIAERIARCASVIALPAVVLWSRQSPQATLRVDSLVTALSQSLFWSGPTVLLVATLFRFGGWSLFATLISAVVMAITWWISARDVHSTAAFTPAVLGWIVLPFGLVVLRWIQWLFEPRSGGGKP